MRLLFLSLNSFELYTSPSRDSREREREKREREKPACDPTKKETAKERDSPPRHRHMIPRVKRYER
jgi:hypothetical protein